MPGATETAALNAAIINAAPSYATAVTAVPRQGAYLTEGPAKTLVQMPAATNSPIAGGFILSRTSSDGKLAVKETVSSFPLYVSWNVEIDNRGASERLFEVTLSIDSNVKRYGTFWDGLNSAPIAQGSRQKRQMLCLFPMAAAWDSNNGLGIGINPRHDYGYIADGLTINNGKVYVEYYVRIVAEAGQKQSVEFMLTGFGPKYGWRQGVQQYFDAFPEVFLPASGIDPRITGTGGYMWSGKKVRDLEVEEARRFNFSWEWSYSPYQTNGDWYSEEPEWVVDNGWTGPNDVHTPTVKGPYSDWYNNAIDRFVDNKGTAAKMYYFIPQLCEINLLSEKYPDSYWIVEDGNWYPQLYPGLSKVFGNYNPMHRWVFGANGTYAEAVIRDLGLTLQNLKVPGFAFDCAESHLNYYGPLQYGMHRSWDEMGRTYVSEAFVYAAICDWIHNQNVNGFKAGTILNMPMRYVTAKRADVSLEESDSYSNSYYVSLQMPMRLLMGRKPVTWWNGWHTMGDLLKTDTMTKQELVQSIQDITKYTIMRGLAMGIIPSVEYQRGNKTMCQWVPKFMELTNAGWHPSPGFTAGNDLFTSRYGNGTNTFLAIGNPTATDVNGTAIIDNAHLQADATIVSTYDGLPVETRFGGTSSSFAYLLKSKDSGLYAGAVQIKGSGISGKGTASFTRGVIQSSQMNIELHLDTLASGNANCWLPAGARLMGATVNGTAITATQNQGSAVVPFGGSTNYSIVIRYMPNIAADANDLDILNYPYMNGDNAACTIVVPDNATEAEKLAAKRLSVYFKYYKLRQRESTPKYRPLYQITRVTPQPAVIPVVTEANAPKTSGNVIVVSGQDPNGMCKRLGFTTSIDTNQPGFIKSSNAGTRKLLMIGSLSDQMIDPTMKAMLHKLDTKYPFYGGLLTGVPALVATGLEGTVIE